MNLKDQYDPSLRKLISKKNQTAIIAIGSMEQHGAHLPVSTDSDISTEIAKQIAEKSNFLLLPTVTFGVSFEHSPFFNLSIKKITLQKIILDLILSLYDNKIRNLIIINGHHGNQGSLQNISNKVKKILKGKMKVFVFSYWNYMKLEFDHAGFVETSLMLAISNKVRMQVAKKGLITKGMSEKEKFRLKKLASKSFPLATKNGIWGDPRKASIKDGNKILSEIVKNLHKKCQTCLTG